MKSTFTATCFLLLTLGISALAQTEKSGVKLVRITQTIESEIVYSDLDRISVNFTVYYTNQPDKDKKETNYVISYKCSAPDSLLDTLSIRLDEPINYLALKTELNQKLQVKGDSVRPLQGNTIMKLFVAFSSVSQLEEKRLAVGNLIVQDYIRTYKKDDKQHEERQAIVSTQTSKVMVLNIEIDSLTKEIETLSDTISKNKLFIKSEDERILNVEALREENTKEIKELTERRSRLNARRISLDTLINRRENSLSEINEEAKKNAESESANVLIVSTTQNLVNTAESEKGMLEKYLSALLKLNKSSAFGLDTTTGTFSILLDSLKRNVLKEDTIVLNNLLKDGYLKAKDPTQIEIAKIDLAQEITDFDLKIKDKVQSINSFREVLDIQRPLISETRVDVAKLEDNRSKIDRVRRIEIDDREKNQTELEKIQRDIAKAEASGRELADIPGLKRIRDERDSTNAGLKRENATLSARLTLLRRFAKEENKKLIADGIFQIFKLHIQIERGYIERIQVFIPDATGNLSIFENIHAIGFSSVKNFMRFTRTKLFARLSPDKFVYLSDVFANYENFLENYTRDYCPGDTTINDFKPSDGFISLQRETFKNLFDTKVFTDFEGIDPNKPNGLIQFEVARRFNIKTSRIQIKNSRSDVGWLTYFNAFGSLNKIEKDKRVLELRNENVVRDNQVVSPYYATSLDFRRYQNFALGGELNLFLFDWPDGKLTSYLDIGAAYGHTPVVQRPLNVADPSSKRDSVVLSGHSSTVYPKVSVELLSEKRIGFVLSFQFNRTVLFSNNNFKPVASYAKSDLTSRAMEPYARNSHVVECYIRAMPTNNRDGRFFFRARYFIQQRDRNTFFAQFQFGYSYNIKLKGFDV